MFVYDPSRLKIFDDLFERLCENFQLPPTAGIDYSAFILQTGVQLPVVLSGSEPSRFSMHNRFHFIINPNRFPLAVANKSETIRMLLALKKNVQCITPKDVGGLCPSRVVGVDSDGNIDVIVNDDL